MNASPSEQPSAPKSLPATSSTKAPTHSVPPHSRSSARPGQRAKYSGPATQIDLSNARNDRATAALIRRVLCSQSGHGSSDQSLQKERATPQPLEELLPPLTSSNEVDLQLYALIAIVMREFVFAWYSKITPDNVFAEELIQVAAHCTRALEQRMRRVDLDALLLDEIPSLIEAHVLAYRTALQSAHASQFKTQFRAVYHSLSPHRALSPVPDISDPASVSKQKEAETVYRQLLAQGILAVLLPTEDLENTCFRTVTCDILADLLFGKIVSDKVCEGWFLWGTVAKLVSELKTRWMERKSKEGRLGAFDPSPTESHASHGDGLSHKGQSRLSSLLWGILQFCYLTYVSIRFVVSGLFRVASTPSKGSVSTSSPVFSINPAKGAPGSTESGMSGSPVIKYRFFGMLAQLADVPRRMPWLGGMLALVQHQLLTGPGRLGESGGVVDRFLRETINNHLLVPTLLPTLLLSIRATLFPGNARPAATPPHQQHSATSDVIIDTVSHFARPNRKSGHTTPDSSQQPVAALQPAPVTAQPSESQIQAIKRDCASSIASLIPRQAALTIFCIRGKASGRGRGTTTPSGGLSQTQPAHSGNSSTPPTASTSPSPTGDGNNTPKPDAQSEFGPGQGFSDQDARSGSGLTPDDVPVSSHPNRSASVTPNNDDGDDDDEDQRLQIRSAIERDILDLFSDSYCNKHLVFAIIEAVVVKVIPELADQGVAELMADRGL